MIFFRGIKSRSTSSSSTSKSNNKGSSGGKPQEVSGSNSKGGGSSSEANHQHQHGGIKKSNNSTSPNKEEILMQQVNHLQSEMSRLNLQLASMQAHHHYHHHHSQGKEELSTQKSNRTFSTKGTTQPNNNYTPGSNISRVANSRPGPEARMQDEIQIPHYPEYVSSKDRPPPVSQIFIPTPATMGRSVARSHHSHSSSNRSPKSPKVVTSGIERQQRGHQQQQYPRSEDSERVPSEHKRHSNNKNTAPQAIVQRPKMRSWRSFQSSVAGPSKTSRSNCSSNENGSKSSTARRVLYRTVRRISSGSTPRTPSIQEASSPPRPSLRGKMALQPPCLLRTSNESGGQTPASTVGEAQSKNDSSTKEHNGSKPTAGKIRVVWPPPPKSKDAKSFGEATFARNEVDKNKKASQPRQPAAPTTKNVSQFVVPPSKLKGGGSGNQNKSLLLSEIRRSDVKLRPAVECSDNHGVTTRTTPNSENDKSGWGGLFAAIQGGVALKHIDTTRKNTPNSQESPTSALLLKLQQRKKECMRQQQQQGDCY